MSQPTWRTVYVTDSTALLEDTTEVYAPELMVAEDAGDGTWQVFRFPLDRCALAGDAGDLLVPATIAGRSGLPHPAPSYVVWFAADLASVGASVGATEADLINALCCEDAGTRAEAYLAIGGYHGMMNFDAYPESRTEAQMEHWPERA